MSDYSKSQEYRIRDIVRKCGLKAERVPLSGACHSIGVMDVIVEGGKLLIDNKSTIAKHSTTIKREDLMKAKAQASPSPGVLSFTFKYHDTVYGILPLEEIIMLYKNLWDKQE